MTSKGRASAKLLAGVTVTLALLVVSSDHVAVAGTAWHWLNPRPQGNSITAIGCSSPTVCIANASREVMRTTDSGSHWQAVDFPLPGSATAVACPSATVCYATGTTGDAAISTDAGQTWTPLVTGVVGDFLVTISCPTTSTCFAAGDGGSIVATTDSGETWVSRSAGHNFYSQSSLACPTTTKCFLGSSNGLFGTTDGGLSWNVVLHQWTQGVSCPSALTCFVAGNPTYKTTDGGISWSSESVTGANRGFIECADEAHCVQSGATPIGEAVLLTTGDGISWATTLTVHYPVNFVSAPACTSDLSCIAGGSLGVIFRSQDGGATWTEIDVAFTRGNFGAISCSGEAFCVAVGRSTDQASMFIAVTHDGGMTWARPTVPVDDYLSGVSCPSTSVCVAVGLNANILNTTDGGVTWQVTNVNTGPYLNEFVGVSCPSVSTCFAVTQGGLFFRTENGGRSWVQRATFGINFRGLDCPTTTVCYLASPQIGQSVMEVTIDGGARWTARSLPGVLIWSVSCTDRSHCVGVGTCHSIFYCSGYQAVVTTDAGRTWEGTNPLYDSPQFVSCGSPTKCVAVGSAGQGEIPGNIQVSNDGGFTWSDLPIIDESLLRGVSCGTTECWAVGDGGAILTD